VLDASGRPLMLVDPVQLIRQATERVAAQAELLG